MPLKKESKTQSKTKSKKPEESPNEEPIVKKKTESPKKKKEYPKKKKDFPKKKTEPPKKKEEPPKKKEEPPKKKEEPPKKKPVSPKKKPVSPKKQKIDDFPIKLDDDILEIIDVDDTNTTYKSDYREIINTYNHLNNKTSSKLTIYEAALIIGKRATQIIYGAEPFIDYNENDTPEELAIRELLMKKVPYLIKRQVNNIIEYWKIEHMHLDEEIISIYN
jgi:DNA-directed RNA polymerase subunit K/omega